MAPTAPPKEDRPLSARQKRLARISGAIHPLAPHKVHRPTAQVPDGFLATKKDKRLVKHSSFVSRIQKSHEKKNKTPKRRRPGKKLVATLESLADALPEIEPEVRQKTLASKPGGLKRKERLVKVEMARFGARMAQLAAMSGGSTVVAEKEVVTSKQQNGAVVVSGGGAATPAARAGGSAGNRWAWLQSNILANMDQNPAFTDTKTPR